MKLFKQTLKNLITEKMSCYKKIIKTLFLILSLAILATSCKKEKINPNVDPSIVGTWSNVRPIGSFRNIVTQLELKEDGTGNEFINNITTSSSTITSDENLTWKTENNNVLKIVFNDGDSEVYTYVINTAEETLTLTNTSGDSKEFFKLE